MVWGREGGEGSGCRVRTGCPWPWRNSQGTPCCTRRFIAGRPGRGLGGRPGSSRSSALEPDVVLCPSPRCSPTPVQTEQSWWRRGATTPQVPTVPGPHGSTRGCQRREAVLTRPRGLWGRPPAAPQPRAEDVAPSVALCPRGSVTESLLNPQDVARPARGPRLAGEALRLGAAVAGAHTAFGAPGRRCGRALGRCPKGSQTPGPRSWGGWEDRGPPAAQHPTLVFVVPEAGRLGAARTCPGLGPPPAGLPSFGDV